MSENEASMSDSCFNFRLSIRGRLGRKHYVALFMFWNSMMLLSCFIASLLLIRIFLAGDIKYLNIFWFVILGAFFIYALSNVSAITIRRLHDINLSGWWLVPLFLPIVGGFFSFFTLTLPGTLACSMRFAGMNCIQSFLGLSAGWIYFPFIYGFMGFWWLITFFMPGTALPNRFGALTPKASKLVTLMIYGAGAMLLILGMLMFFLFAVLNSGLKGLSHC